MIIERSINNPVGSMYVESIFKIQNNSGTEKGATIDVVIAMLAASSVFPFKISVKTGAETPAGIETRSKTAMASCWLKGFIIKKNTTGITAMYISSENNTCRQFFIR